MTVLAIEDLHVWFELPDGKELHAVQGIDLSLERGERLGLVGESGCGKTTAILAMMGLLPPTASAAGRILLDGEDILAGGDNTMRAHRWTDIAMVFQGAMNAFDPVKTIGSQIREPMQAAGLAKGKAARARTGELRAAIAMALACEPKVLLADEPTTALDVMVQAQILELLIRLTDELGLAMIMVTHDLPLVSQVCQRAAVMYAGRISEIGTTSELYHHPQHPYTRMLFRATPDLLAERDVISIPGSPPRLDQEIIGCPFRPRCDAAIDTCAIAYPPTRTAEPGHLSACFVEESA